MTDREKIIEILKQACRFSCGEEYCKHHHEQCVGRNADYLIANGVRLERKQATSDKTSEWISVEDKLPPFHTEVLVVSECEIYMAGNVLTWEDGHATIYIYELGEFRPFTHWMHLPELPKEG